MAIGVSGVPIDWEHPEGGRNDRLATDRSDQGNVSRVRSYLQGMGWAQASAVDQSSGFDPEDTDEPGLPGEAVSVPVRGIRAGIVYFKVYELV